MFGVAQKSAEAWFLAGATSLQKQRMHGFKELRAFLPADERDIADPSGMDPLRRLQHVYAGRAGVGPVWGEDVREMEFVMLKTFLSAATALAFCVPQTVQAKDEFFEPLPGQTLEQSYRNAYGVVDIEGKHVAWIELTSMARNPAGTIGVTVYLNAPSPGYRTTQFLYAFDCAGEIYVAASNGFLKHVLDRDADGEVIESKSPPKPMKAGTVAWHIAKVACGKDWTGK